jgi:hypothetical protein
MHVTFFPQQMGWLGGKRVEFHPWVTRPKFFKRLKSEFQNETTKEENSWGTPSNLQHYGGRRVCLSFGMGIG